jgi:hypothetical protein
VGLRASLDVSEKRTPLALQRFEPQFFGRPSISATKQNYDNNNNNNTLNQQYVIIIITVII